MGDGQIQYVLEHEIKAIQSCMAKAGLPDDQVKLTYIIVNKKINTKFISGPSPGNPLCGTVIDDVVTLPERYNLLLTISQPHMLCIKFLGMISSSCLKV